jgi:predicted nucleic acid-binding protein
MISTPPISSTWRSSARCDGHLDLATRAWELRHNFTVYDAIYLALAEALGATVVTCDAPFGATSRRVARIEVIRPAGH